MGGGQTQLHKANSNVVSLLHACSLPSASCCINRMETIMRLPLISGIKLSAGSMNKRNNWNLPWGRFCWNTPAVAETFWALALSRMSPRSMSTLVFKGSNGSVQRSMSNS